MLSRKTRAGILVVAVVGLLGGTNRPIEAATVATAKFEATLEIPGGLGYPCTPPGSLEECPPNPTDVQGVTRGFSLSSTVCQGTKLDLFQVGKDGHYHAPDCEVDAGGTIKGFCGMATGTGWGSVWWGGLTGSKEALIFFEFVAVGGFVFVDGTTGKGDVTAVLEAFPDPTGGGSCTNGTAAHFIVAGTLEIVDGT